MFEHFDWRELFEWLEGLFALIGVVWVVTRGWDLLFRIERRPKG